MHIPDGYLSPETAAAFYCVAAPFWYVAGGKLKRVLTGQTVPLIAIFSAFCFTIMMFNVPIPGGTTAHAVGGTLAAIVLGPWAAIIAVSVALVIQALFFGDGGITAIGANCFNMAIVLPMVGYGFYRLFSGRSDMLSRRRVIAAAIGSYIGINTAAFCVGVELGIQPIFWSSGGKALYAPYPLSVSIPSMMLAHLTLAGAAELIATAFAVAYIQRAHPHLLTGQISRPAAEPVAPVAAGPTLASPKSRLTPLAEPERAKRRAPSIALIAIAAVILVPLGLLASGSAWGEWGSGELGQKVGYVPSGMQGLESIWKAPFSGYDIPWIPAGAGFGERSLGYILSAVVGIGIIFTIVFALRVIARRRAEARAVAET